MKKKLTLVTMAICLTIIGVSGDKIARETKSENYRISVLDSVNTDVVLEPNSYTENFESQVLRAWASYPIWQDNAYDQNFKVCQIVPDNPNLSFVAKVTPYSNVDNYVGAQKLLDMYLVPGARVKFRYYLKTIAFYSPYKDMGPVKDSQTQELSYEYMSLGEGVLER